MEGKERKKVIQIQICKQPKTVICLDAKLSKEEKQKRIARYLDKNGKLKIDTAKSSLYEKGVK